MTKKKQSLVLGSIFLVLSIVLYCQARSIKTGSSLLAGADFMPKVMAILLMLVSIAYLVQGFANKVTEVSRQNDAKKKTEKMEWIRLVLEFLLLFGYLFCLKPIGFIISTMAFIFLQSILITPKENRKILLLLIVAGVCTVITYLIFVKGFKLLLPAGILG